MTHCCLLWWVLGGSSSSSLLLSLRVGIKMSCCCCYITFDGLPLPLSSGLYPRSLWWWRRPGKRSLASEGKLTSHGRSSVSHFPTSQQQHPKRHGHLQMGGACGEDSSSIKEPNSILHKISGRSKQAGGLLGVRGSMSKFLACSVRLPEFVPAI